ncbi:MAG: ABC transporter substrate-binding protein [Actinomycetota bacterium]
MRRRIRARRRTAAVSAALLLAASCSPGDEADPSAGGTVTVGLPGIGSLQPAEATSPAALAVLRAACDPLIAEEPATGELEPALADRWTVEEGGMGLSIRLKAGARFHGGAAVVPARVAEYLSGIGQTGGASPAARRLAALLRPGEDVSGTIRVTDDGALRIDLPQPFAGLPVLLADPALVPLASADEGSAELPDCAGPYRIRAAEGGVDLVRDPGYTTGNGAFSGGGRGYAATIRVRAYESAEAAYEALRAGEVDAAPVPASRVAEVEAQPSGHVRRGTAEITYLAFDLTGGVTADPAFRRAVSLAVDRVALVDANFGDRRPPATRWLVEAPDRPSPAACESGARRVAQPDRARQMLAEAGIDPAGVRLPLLFDQARTSPRVAQAVAVQLEENLSIDVRPQGLDVAEFEAAVAGGAGPRAWVATTPGDLSVPEQVLEALFRTGSPANTNRFTDARMDELLAEARQAAGPGERTRAHAQAEDRACELMGGVPLWSGVSHWAFAPDRVSFSSPVPIDALGGLLLREARPR